MPQPAEMDAWNVSVPEIMDMDRYLSSANAPDIEEDVRLCIEGGARAMILNCSELTYMTGAGVRALLNIARMMQQAGGTLSVKALSGQPREIFNACGMDLMISSLDEMTAASITHAA
jgi:anti-sigma B factor antagonist